MVYPAWPSFDIRYDAAKNDSQISYCLDLYALDQEIRHKGSWHTNPVLLLFVLINRFELSWIWTSTTRLPVLASLWRREHRNFAAVPLWVRYLQTDFRVNAAGSSYSNEHSAITKLEAEIRRLEENIKNNPTSREGGMHIQTAGNNLLEYKQEALLAQQRHYRLWAQSRRVKVPQNELFYSAVFMFTSLFHSSAAQNKVLMGTFSAVLSIIIGNVCSLIGFWSVYVSNLFIWLTPCQWINYPSWNSLCFTGPYYGVKP